MSTKLKKKTTKTKKIRRAELKFSYSDEEKIELRNRYNDILNHLSHFLSEHSVYEAVPENVKILVFSSELSIYEIIKVFIFEDIYCGLIYNPSLNNYLGLLTTRDLMLLYKYIIDNFPGEKIEDFDVYLKNIFSQNKIIKKEDINENNNNNSKSEYNNINIFQYLKNINYLDYLIHVKNKELQNINIFSVSLDDNLYETLEKINIKNIHRLLVEDDIKKELRNNEKIKEGIKENEQITLKRKEELQNKRVISNAEKTTSANDSDEQNKNIPIIDIKKIMETNKDDIIIEKSEHTLTKDEIELSKDKIKKEEEKNEINNINNNIKNEDINNDENLENLNINEIEQKKEAEKPKKKKIVKKKKIKSTTIQQNDLKITEEDIEIIKKRGTKQIETEIKTIINGSDNEINTEGNEKKIIKKKVKKKVAKKKKDINLELPEEIDNKIENKEDEHTHKKINTNIGEYINEEKMKSEEVNKAITESNIPKTDKKKKIKKKITKKKSKQITEKLEDKLEKVINDNINNNDNNNDKKENKEEHKEEINNKENNKEEENNNINKNLEEIISDDENKEKNLEEKSITNSLKNIKFENKMKNYVGIVTNETIFEYLSFNYYSNDMKEFDLSLNELLILGENTFLKPLTNINDSKEKTYNTFNYHLGGHYDIIPIFTDNEIEGFIYPKDFLFYIYNCESDQNLTNREFLENLYEDIDDEKPYGKNRVVYLELNDTTKTFYVKELIERLNCSIEKKIVLIDPNDNKKLFLISLKTIFKAIFEFNLNK